MREFGAKLSVIAAPLREVPWPLPAVWVRGPVGARFAQTYAWEAEVSASLTWVSVGAVGESDVGSNVGQLINKANEIENRILSLNSEFSYPVSHRARLGAGYRFQQFVDSVQLDPIDLDETVHTVTFQFSFDLEGSD